MADSKLYKVDEVAKILNISRFTVYELIKRNELPVYRIGRSMRIAKNDLDTYTKQAKNEPLHGEYASMPVEASTKNPDTESIIICGQDLVLDILSNHLEKILHVHILRRYVGSISGLTSLYNRTAHIASVHLWDGDNDDYNVAYARRYLPGENVQIINLVFRTEGFYVAPGNPKNILDWEDLIRENILFINRERGAGARVLLDEKFRQLHIDPHEINGYDNEEMSHLAVASCVARGDADVGLGTEKAAMQVQGVEFIPLKKERYDLIVLNRDINQNHRDVLLEILRSNEFRKEIEGLGGYDVSRMGEIIAEL